MPNDDYQPEYSELEKDYQVLTELHRSNDSVTYLARHLGLNRDVTITIMRGVGGDNSALGKFAEDARLLTRTRDSHIIPVIEGRWLDTNTFAIVHARVRGSTLEQLAGAFGPMPLARVASTLDSVESALEWARKNGVANRYVSADSVVFQQGSERVMVAFAPAIAVADVADDRCADARTIGRLAWQMLSGRSPVVSKTESLAELRPELSPRIIEETNAMMNCRRDGVAPDVAAFIALVAGRADAAPVRTFQRAPNVVLPRARTSVPVGASDDAVVVVNRGMSFNTRLAMAAAVVALIVIMAVLLLQRRGPDASLTATTSTPEDTAMQAAGDVALRAQRIDSAMIAKSTAAQPLPQPMPAQVMPAPVVPRQPLPQAVTPQMTPPTTRVSPIVPPETRRNEPLKTTEPVLKVPVTPPPADSATAKPPAGDVCASPEAADQHSCLMNAIDRNDVQLNRV